MKRKLITASLGIISMCLLWGCTKDNFKEPGSTITGRVVYQGQPVGVRSNGVTLELWQPGYDLFTKVVVNVAQDGSFSAKVFDGRYLLTRLRGNGPWIDQTDSIEIKLNGTANVEVPVTPYFTVANDVFTYNNADSTISGTFNIAQVTAGRAIENITMHVSTTDIVDATNQIAFASISVAPPANALTAPVTLKVDIRPRTYALSTQATSRLLLGDILQKKYAFVRFGVKPVGVAERVYTMVKKVQFP